MGGVPHLNDELIARALAGALSPAESTQLLLHAQGCLPCRAQLDSDPAGAIKLSLTTAAGPSAGRPGEPEVPIRLGRYVVLDRLGAGGMGVVYSAFDPELDRRIAVKVLRPRSTGGYQEGAQARLVREAQAMARLAHPNVIAVFDVGTLGNAVFFAMERVDGGTLRDWLRTRRSWREILAVFVQAGRGLAAAHAAGIVHRDFKPENVLIARDGRVRVTDFGLARALDEQATAAADLAGTPGYLAPEQLDGAITAHSDQFSFCVALYEALVGERPFARAPLAAYARQLRDGRVEFPPGTQAPAFVRQAVLRGLGKQATARFVSMEALLDALTRDPRARRLRLGAIVTLGALLVGGGGGAVAVRVREQRACSLLAGQAAARWERARPAVASAVTATNRSFAAAALRTVEATLGSYARQWGEARASVCRGSAPLSPELRAASASCLDLAAHTIDETTRLLAAGDVGVVQRAAEMMAGLPSVHDCMDAGALGSAPRPPDRPEVARLVASARTRLARARVLAIPRPQEGISTVRSMLDQIQGLSYPPVLAEAYFVLGQSALAADITGDAERWLQQAAELALAGRDDRLFVRAASRLAYVLGGFHGQQARAGDWLSLARQAFERAGSPPSLGPWLDLQQVGVLIGAGRWDECAKVAERAVAGARRLGDRFHDAEASFLLAHCRRFTPDTDQLLAAVEQALQRYLDVAGPDHPETANAMGAVSYYRWLIGDLKGSLPLREQSIAVNREIGRPTLQLANALENQAKLLAELGRDREALAARREAWDILNRVPHPPTGNIRILAGLAASERSTGLRSDAYRHARQAAAACTDKVFQTFPDACAFAHFVHAQLLLDRGQRGLAARQAARARDGFATLPIARRLRAQVESWATQAGIALGPEPPRT